MPEEVKAAIDESLAKLKKEYDIEVVDQSHSMEGRDDSRIKYGG